MSEHLDLTAEGALERSIRRRDTLRRMREFKARGGREVKMSIDAAINLFERCAAIREQQESEMFPVPTE